MWSHVSSVLSILPRRPRSTFFPYTTLFRSQVRHGQREVLAQQVITRIADENPGEDLPAKASVGAVYFFFRQWSLDRKSTRLNSSHLVISYAVFCLKKKNFFCRFTPSNLCTL